MRNTVVLLIAGAALLVALAVFVMLLGPPSSEVEGDRSGAAGTAAATASSGRGPSPEGFEAPGASRIDAGAGGTASNHGLGTAGDEPDQGTTDGMVSPPRKHTGHTLDEADELPMAVKGLELGIDTSMDDDWTPRNEAEQWFEPLHDAFEEARPLTADVYNEILGDHRETTVDVLKRSGEIGDVLGSEKGLAFLDEWNTLMDPYKVEAYGR